VGRFFVNSRGNARTPIRQRVSRTSVTKIVAYLCGIAILGIGIAGLLHARLGTAPLDAINAGLANKTGLSVGVCSWIDAAIVLGLAWAFGRRPKVGTVLLSLLLGLAINLGLTIVPNATGLGAQLAMATVSLVAIYVGVTAFIVADIGAGSPEELMLALVHRGFRLHRARWGIEAALLAIALLLRGPINIVTIVFVAVTGPILAWTIPRAARLLRLPLPHHDPNVPLGEIR